MRGLLFQTKTQEYISPSQQPFFLPHNTIFPPPISPPPPPSISYQSDNTFNKISPSILLIIIILAIIFFISGLLHLLVRFLFRPTNRDPEDLDNVTALQGQLQQLFHLHDSGVDQSYIDTLPVFLYKAIIGLKNPFDCAVCLCEFEADDKLRLLPKCSHAFHLECIDTWLLSHSTCPICRGSLLPEFPYNNNGGCYPPVVLVLESGSESSREFVSGRDLGTNSTNTTTIIGTGNQIGCLGEDEFGSSRTDCSKKLNEISEKEESVSAAVIEEKVVTVKLGKFRNVDPPTAPVGQGEASNNSNVDARRCFSMGSFEYVMDETSSLQVPIRPQVRKQSSKKPSIPLTPGHRTAMSECDCHSSREGFRGFDTLQIHSGDSNSNKNSIASHKKDSFSFSKIWLRSKKEKPSSSVNSASSSRRAFSFRIPLQKVEAVSADDFKTKEISNTSSRRTISEMDVSRWESSASEMGFDEETGSHNSLDSQPSMPSFARRTILWLAGKQNKVVHSSSPNV